MKKNLIVALALVFVLGIAGTAFAAANPFVDVPARHWAYDAVSKLAKAGILDGYGDGTYRGERLASRYEMAQATAKAMARADKADAQMKALIDKLAVEFAAELNNLGVRVAKLEKNASTIKFTGDARIRYQSNVSLDGQDYRNAAANQTTVGSNRFNQRVRVNAVADVNDKVQFFGRLMAEWTSNQSNAVAGDQSSNVYWDYGYFQFKNSPTFTTQVGRTMLSLGQGTIAGTNGYHDGFVVAFGDPLKVRVSYGDLGRAIFPNSYNLTTAYNSVYVWGINLEYAVNKDWTLTGATLQSTSGNYRGGAAITTGVGITNTVAGSGSLGESNQYPYQVYALGFNGKLNNQFRLQGEYIWNSNQLVIDANPENTPNAFLLHLSYLGANRAKVGSWGAVLKYKDVKPYAIPAGGAVYGGMLANSPFGAQMSADGAKGWGVDVNYTFAKNAIFTLTYEQLSKTRKYSGAAQTTFDNTFASDRYAAFWYAQANFWF